MGYQYINGYRRPVDRSDPSELPYYRKTRWKAVVKEAFEVNAGIVAAAIVIAATTTGPTTSPKWILVERILGAVMILAVFAVLVVGIRKLRHSKRGYDRVDAWTGLFQGLAWAVPMCVLEILYLIFYTRSGAAPPR